MALSQKQRKLLAEALANGELAEQIADAIDAAGEDAAIQDLQNQIDALAIRVTDLENA